MRSLVCSSCGARGTESFTIERGQNTRRRNGKKRTAVNVVCKRCRHEWFSVNPVAVRAAKAADAEARG